MWQRLRRNLITGFFVTVPLAVSVFTLVWVFRHVDNLTSGLSQALFGWNVPGLGVVTTAAFLLVVGSIATNVFGRRLLQRGEALLMHIPVFKTVYGPVKQLIAAFSPENDEGFKRVVLVEDASRGYVLGFLTKEFTMVRDGARETVLAVYVPTNNLYLGNVIVCPRDKTLFPDVTVEEGVRIFLTGGMALPGQIRLRPAGTHEPAADA